MFRKIPIAKFLAFYFHLGEEFITKGPRSFIPKLGLRKSAYCKKFLKTTVETVWQAHHFLPFVCNDGMYFMNNRPNLLGQVGLGHIRSHAWLTVRAFMRFSLYTAISKPKKEEW